MQKPWNVLKEADTEIFDLIEKELLRQRNGIELIASENFASAACVAAAGNVLTNKYAEGRPAKRYYGGCDVVDQLENVAIDRACRLFGASFANVQPHSGAQANASVFLALLNPGDSILGLDLSQGGHLTHGSKVNFSGLIYRSEFYGLNLETGTLDYNQIADAANAVKPKAIIAGASAYPRLLDFSKFREIADSVGAYLVVDMAHIAGLVAAGLHPNPIPHAHVVTTTTHKTLRGPRGGLMLWNDESLTLPLNKGVFPGTQGGPLEHIIAAKAVCFREAMDPSFRAYQSQVVSNAQALGATLVEHDFDLVSGGTDNHLLLVDLSKHDISGKDFENALESAAITVNKNTVPNEKRSPFVTSGIRVGTPAVTTRGMGQPEMVEIGNMFKDVLERPQDKSTIDNVRQRVERLANSFPLYPEW